MKKSKIFSKSLIVGFVIVILIGVLVVPSLLTMVDAATDVNITNVTTYHEYDYFNAGTGFGSTVTENGKTVDLYCSESGSGFYYEYSTWREYRGLQNVVKYLSGDDSDMPDALRNYGGAGVSYFEKNLKPGMTISRFATAEAYLMKYTNENLYNLNTLIPSSSLTDGQSQHLAFRAATSSAVHSVPSLFYNYVYGYGDAAARDFPAIEFYPNDEGITYGSPQGSVHIVKIDNNGNLTRPLYNLTYSNNPGLVSHVDNLIKIAWYMSTGNYADPEKITAVGTTYSPEVSTKLIDMKEDGNNYKAEVLVTTINQDGDDSNITISVPSGVTYTKKSAGTTTYSKQSMADGKFYLPIKKTEVTYVFTVSKTGNANKTFDISVSCDKFATSNELLYFRCNGPKSDQALAGSDYAWDPVKGTTHAQAMFGLASGSTTLKDTIKLKTPSADGYVYVTKTVPTGYNPNGAKFALYSSRANANTDSNRITTLTVDETGKTSTYKLQLNGNSLTIYAKEVGNPTQSGDFDWISDKEIKELTITGANTASNPAKFSFTNDVQEYGYIRIKKTVPTGYSPVGASFGVYASQTDANNKTNSLATLTIASGSTTGTYRVKLPQGVNQSTTIYVRELTPPNATGNFTWKIDDSVKSAKISKVNTKPVPYEFNIDNKVQEYGWAIVHKDVPTGYRPDGAIYTVYTDAACKTVAPASIFANGKVQNFTIGSDGNSNKIQFNVPTGSSLTVYVKETNPPTQNEDGFTWKMDTKIYKITMDVKNPESKPFRVDSKNEVDEYGYSYVIKKSDKPRANDKLKGTTFTVYMPDGKTVAKDYKTGENVVLTISDLNTLQSTKCCLLTGTYILRETVTPAGFDPSPDRTITIQKGKTTSIVVTNHYRTEFASVQKTSDRPELIGVYTLAGTKLGIYTDAACTTLAKDINDGKDCILIVGEDLNSNKVELPLGTYYVKEISTTQWYELNVEIIKIVLDTDGEHVELPFMNYLQKGLGQVEKGFK